MFETSRDPEKTSRADIRTQPDARPDAPVTSMDTEFLALLCPDWRNAIVVLDFETLAVSYANFRALEMFKRRYPLFVSHGVLQMTSPHSVHRLRSTLRQALAGEDGEASIIIDDEVEDFTYGVRACVPQGFMREVLRRNLLRGSFLVVLEIVSSKIAVSKSELRALAAAFSLTLAETCILAFLCEGRSLIEIAALRSVAFETVRHQCKSLLYKTRSGRQSDLVRLALTFCSYDTLGG